MKKLFLTVITLLVAFNLATALSVEDFKISTTDYEQAFEELSTLEDYVVQNNLTLTDLSVKNLSLITQLQLKTNYSVMNMFDLVEPPLGIPSFVWGLCCGVSGLAVVYFVTDDSEQTKKALNGCLVSTGISVVLTVLYYVWIINAFY